MRSSLVLTSLVGLLSFTAAQSNSRNLNPTGAGCVDPEAYLSCYETQLKQFTQCAQVANSTCSDTTAHLQTCMAGCDGHYLASKIGCWLESCWNRVYSCEYQQTAAEYVVGVGLVQASVSIPFYPPPDGDLPGGCDCNVGHAVGNFTDDAPYHCMRAAETGDRAILGECTCCQSAIPISNALNACPKSDLSFIGFETRLQSVQNTMSQDTPNQCAVLDSGLDSAAYCAQTYGVVELAGPVIYNPLKLPAGIPGTAPLSNLPGNAFTTFTSVLTLALDPGYQSTISPVPFNSANADKTSATGAATNTASAGASSAGGSGTGTGPAATSTSRSAAGKVKVEVAGFGLVVVGLVAVLGL